MDSPARMDRVATHSAMLRLANPVRPYSWGSTAAIADLLGIADDGEPKAELWLGAHPDSPSVLPDGGAPRRR